MSKSNYHECEINGAKVAGYTMPGMHSVVIYVIVKAGAWYEEANQRGYFHLMEHCLFNGSKGLPTKEEIDNYTEQYGIIDNAWTGNESMGFVSKCPDIYVDKSLDLFEKLVFSPIISPETITKEVKIITQEFNDAWNSPYKRFAKIYSQMLLGEGHPYTKQSLTTLEDLPKADSQTLLAIHDRHFQPQNMVIAVAGNFDWDKVKDQLEMILNKIPNKEKISLSHPPITTQPGKIVYEDDVKQSLVAINWLMKGTDKLTEKERLTLNMIREMLGNNRRSLLNKRIREELGIAYQTGCKISDWKVEMGLEAWAQTDKNNAELAASKIIECLNEFRDKKYSKENFERTRQFMSMQTLMYYDSVGNVAEDLCLQMFQNKYNKVYLPEDTVEIASSIEAGDVNELFGRLINTDNAYIGIMNPRSST